MLSAGAVTSSELVCGSGGDDHILQQAGLDQLLARHVGGQQFQHGGGLVADAAGSGRDGVLQRRGQVGGQRVFQLEDPRLVDRGAAALIDAADQQIDFGQIAGRGADDQRIGAIVDGHLDARPQALRSGKRLCDRLLNRRRGRMAQAVHADLRLGRDRHIQLGDQLLHGRDRFAPADQQHGIGLDQRSKVDLALPAADQVLGHEVDDLDQGQAVHEAEPVDVDFRNRLGAQSLQFGDDPRHLVDIRIAAPQNDDVQVGQRFDLDVVSQLAQPFFLPCRLDGFFFRGRNTTDARFVRCGLLACVGGPSRLSELDQADRHVRRVLAGVACRRLRANGWRGGRLLAQRVNGFLHLGGIRPLQRNDADRLLSYSGNGFRHVERGQKMRDLSDQRRVAEQMHRVLRPLEGHLHTPRAFDQHEVRSVVPAWRTRLQAGTKHLPQLQLDAGQRHPRQLQRTRGPSRRQDRRQSGGSGRTRLERTVQLVGDDGLDVRRRQHDHLGCVRVSRQTGFRT